MSQNPTEPHASVVVAVILINELIDRLPRSFRTDRLYDRLIDETLRNHHDNFRRVRSLPGLLRWLAKRALNRLRKQDKRRGELTGIGFRDTEDPHESETNDELIQALRTFVAGLEESDRRIVTAFMIATSERDAARMLEMPPGRFRYRLHSTLARFQEQYDA